MRPFAIGSVIVDPPIALAPMEDVTNLAFRLLVKEIAGPGLMYTEFISAMAVHYGARDWEKKMAVREEERPLAIQIFGAEPSVMADVARKAEAMGADIVDINMGCWVPKVCKTGSGAALLREPDQALRVLEAVVGAVHVPVTVKIRAGWDHTSLAAPSLSPRFESAGAQAITLHARTARQGFDGHADWSLIKEIKELVGIPVLGNGDVRTPEDALRMFAETGCDGVMVGRAAVSNPWALGRIVGAVAGRHAPPEPTLQQRVETAVRHTRLHVEHVGDELRAVRSLRGQLPGYLKGFPGAPALREALSRACSVAEVRGIMEEAGQKAQRSKTPEIA